LVGGYDGADIFKETWRIDLETMEWRKMPHDLPTPTYFNGTTISPVWKKISRDRCYQ